MRLVNALRANFGATILLLSLALCATPAAALPRTRHVGPSPANCDFATIQAAIDGVSSGDTIIIDGGQTYSSQHLLIANKSLSLGTGPCQNVIGGKPDVTAANAQVTLSGDSPSATSAVLTITGTGAVTLSDLKITGNANSNDGGGIEHKGSGALTLNNVLVTGNTGKNGGGVDVSGTGNLVIGNDTQIIGNTASIAGGGIRFSSSGMLTAAGTGNLIANNHAPNGFGGGLFVFGGTAMITATGIGTQPVFYLNNAVNGGGIAVRSTATQAAAVTLGDASGIGMVIDNNSASSDGGGIYLQSYDDGSVSNAAGLSAFNVQITNNSAFDGAAIYSDCPNSATTCAVVSSVDLETDGCTNANCSVIRANTASSPNGAVMTLKNASTLMFNTRILGNEASRLLRVTSGTTFQADDSLITGNTTQQDLMFADSGVLNLSQCTLADNTVGATHLIGMQNAQFTLVNSIVVSDVSALSQTSGTSTVHNVVGTNVDGLPSANDVVLADPAFVDAAHGDYHLRVASNGTAFVVSPAVDFSADHHDGSDIDGRTRPVDVPSVSNRFGAYDLGVYEMQPITDRIFANAFGDLFQVAY